MSKTRKQYTEANRRAWNEAAAKHAQHNNAALFAACGDPSWVSFEGEILATLKALDLQGKDAERCLRLMEALDDHDDVQNVWTNADIPEEVAEQVAAG